MSVFRLCRKIDKFVAVEFVAIVLGLVLLTSILRIPYTLGGIIKIVGCSVVLTSLSLIFDDRRNVLIVTFLETVILIGVVMVTPISDYDDFFRYLIFSCSLVFLLNVGNGLLGYVSYPLVFRSLVSLAVFFPVFGFWVYYYNTKCSISCDTILALLQTNAVETVEYISVNFTFFDVLLIVGSIAFFLWVAIFVLNNKINVRGGGQKFCCCLHLL